MSNQRAIKNNSIVPHFDDDHDERLRIRLRRVENLPGCLVLYLTGYIDVYNSCVFETRVARAIQAGFINLIFHISGTNFVSSCEIGSYTMFLKAVKPRGGDVVLAEMQPKVYEVYQLLGFDQFFNIRLSLDDAFEYFEHKKKRFEDHL